MASERGPVGVAWRRRDWESASQLASARGRPAADANDATRVSCSKLLRPSAWPPAADPSTLSSANDGGSSGGRRFRRPAADRDTEWRWSGGDATNGASGAAVLCSSRTEETGPERARAFFTGGALAVAAAAAVYGLPSSSLPAALWWSLARGGGCRPASRAHRRHTDKQTNGGRGRRGRKHGRRRPHAGCAPATAVQQYGMRATEGVGHGVRPSQPASGDATGATPAQPSPGRCALMRSTRARSRSRGTRTGSAIISAGKYLTNHDSSFSSSRSFCESS